MDSTPFFETIQKLENLISKLEKNVGVPHKPSPFKALSKDKAKEGQEKEKKAEKTDKPKEAKKEKKEDAPKQDKGKKGGKGQPAAPALEPALQDFVKCEFRVGEFTKVWKHPDSEKLYCEEINIGKETRNIASGLQQFVPEENMKGKCVVWVNLKEKKLGGFPSHGMVICASDKSVEGQEKVEICLPQDNAAVGERLLLEGFEEHFPDEKVDPCSSKVLERVCGKFKTDGEGNIHYNGIKVKTSAGYLKVATIKNGNVS